MGLRDTYLSSGGVRAKVKSQPRFLRLMLHQRFFLTFSAPPPSFRDRHHHQQLDGGHRDVTLPQEPQLHPEGLRVGPRARLHGHPQLRPASNPDPLEHRRGRRRRLVRRRHVRAEPGQVRQRRKAAEPWQEKCLFQETCQVPEGR